MFTIPFSAQAMHLYQVLSFPALLYACWPAGFEDCHYQEPQSFRENGEKSAELHMPLGEWLDGIQSALNFRREDISHFFSEAFSFPEALMLKLGLDYPDVQSFLESASVLSEEDLVSSILRTLWPQAKAFQLLLPEESRPLTDFSAYLALLRDPTLRSAYIAAFLRQAGLQAESAWTVLEMLENPRTHLAAYSALLNSFQFISEAIVGAREAEARQAISENLDLLWHERENLPLSSDDKAYFEQLLDCQEEVGILPVVNPFTARFLKGQNILLLGFAIPSLLHYKEQIQEEEIRALSNFCQSLADPTRYKLCCLLGQGSWRQKDLARELNVSQATISHHLSKLKACGLVSQDKHSILELDSFRHYLSILAEDFKLYG